MKNGRLHIVPVCTSRPNTVPVTGLLSILNFIRPILCNNTPYRVSLGLGLADQTDQKRGARLARVAVAGQENIETVHEPKPIQTADTLCMDKVAVL